jgi:hypothetical protein
VAVVLHSLEERLDRLGAEVEPVLGGRERVGLVDEQHAVEGAPDRPLGLDRRQADVLADEAGSVDLDEVAAAEEAHRPVHLREEPRHRCLPRAGVAEEDEVLRGCDLRQAVSLAFRLHTQEGDQRADLLLHRLEPDERVELRLERFETRPGLRLPQRLELIDDPVRAVAAGSGAQPLGEGSQPP